MIVYIEYVLIDNMIIDYVILYLTSLIMRTKISIIRLLFGAGIGTIFAFIMPFLNINPFILVIIKMLVGILICICVNKNIQIKALILFYSIFMLMTFVMGGLCIAIIFLLSGELILINYQLDFPMGVVILIICLYSLYLKKVLYSLKKRSKITDYVYDVKLIENGKEVKILAFFDSGNGLFDVESNKPIAIINLSTLIKLITEEQLNYLLIGEYLKSGLKDIHKINYNTVSSSGNLIVFKVDNVILKENNKLLDVDTMIGVSLNNVVKFNNYDALIGPKILEVENV